MRATSFPMGVALLVALTGASVVLVGCGKARQVSQAAKAVRDARNGNFTVKGENGQEVKVETTKSGSDAGKVKVTSKEGTMTAEFGKDKATEKDLGIAFYPGAKVENTSKFSGTGKESGQYVMATLTTPDAFDKVAKFYKDKYAKGNTVVDQPNNLMISIKAGKNQSKLVVVTRDQDKTEIAIHSGTGM